MARKKKKDPNELVPHPFPKKGSRKKVKRGYREYLIKQAKEAGDKTKPVPLTAEPDLGPDLDLTKAPTKDQPSGPIMDWDGKPPAKPPKNWKEIKIDYEKDSNVGHKLGKIRERGETRIKFKYWSMGKHVYWVHKTVHKHL